MQLFSSKGLEFLIFILKTFHSVGNLWHFIYLARLLRFKHNIVTRKGFECP